MSDANSGSDALILYEELVAERGGPSELAISDMALCRSLARELAAEDPDPRIIVRLAELLPPRCQRQDDDGPQWDWNALSLENLEELEILLSRGFGVPSLIHAQREEQVRLDKQAAEHPEQMARAIEAIEGKAQAAAGDVAAEAAAAAEATTLPALSTAVLGMDRPQLSNVVDLLMRRMDRFVAKERASRAR